MKESKGQRAPKILCARLLQEQESLERNLTLLSNGGVEVEAVWRRCLDLAEGIVSNLHEIGRRQGWSSEKTGSRISSAAQKN